MPERCAKQRSAEGEESGEGAPSPVWGSRAMLQENFEILHADLYILVILASFV